VTAATGNPREKTELLVEIMSTCSAAIASTDVKTSEKEQKSFQKLKNVIDLATNLRH